MSQLNFSEGIYLDHHEMTRFDGFVREFFDKFIQKKSKQLGILSNISQGTASSTDYLVARGTNTDTNSVWTCKSNSGYSIVPNTFKLQGYLPNTDNTLIKSDFVDNIILEDSSDYPLDDIRVVVCRPEIVYIEQGLCSLSATGQLSGVDTKFSELLRGHNTIAPTKIKFIKSDGTPAVNSGIYEVSNISNDTTAQLIGASFSLESSLRYIIVGSYTLSQQINLGTKKQYSFIKSNTLALREVNVLSTDILLANLVSNGDGTFEVIDRRQENVLVLNGELDYDWITLTGWDVTLNLRNDGSALPTIKIRAIGDGTIEMFGRFKFSSEIPSITGYAIDSMIKDNVDIQQVVTTYRKALANVVLYDDIPGSNVYDPGVTATFSWGQEGGPTRLMINITIPETAIDKISINNWYSFYIKQPIGVY